MNKDQQKTVNKMLDAMELDTYGEKGLKEIIRQAVVEIVKRSASPKREPIDTRRITLKMFSEGADMQYKNGYVEGIKFAEKAHGITGVGNE